MTFMITILLIMVNYGTGLIIYLQENNETITDDQIFARSSVQSSGTNCPCGWTNKARIVGGVETKINEFPFASAIVNQRTNTVYCGATLITALHAISAAHCTSPRFYADRKGLLVGDHDYTKKYEAMSARVINIARTIEHEDFNTRDLVNDISLIILEKKAEISLYVGPACLPHKDINLVNQNLQVLGWGRISTRGPASRVLRKVTLKVVPISSCARAFSKVSSKQLCTYTWRKDSCQGDSGGPLVWWDPQINRYTLVGIVSYGRDCASLYPAVNTKVDAYRDWIDQKVKGTSGGEQVCRRNNG